MGCNILKCEFGRFYIPQRYVLCFMCFLGVLNSYCLRVCLSITLPKMLISRSSGNNTKATECTGEPEKSKYTAGIYNWSEVEQSYILGTFFPGYVITHIPGGMLSDTAGGRHVLSQSILIASILSILTPLSAEIGGWWLLSILRFVLGLAQGVLFPAVTTLLAKWVPKNERGTLASFVLTGVQIGSIFGNLISAYLIAWFNSWKVVFYFFGIVSMVWYLLFLLLCFSEPSQHPFITDDEADLLAREIGQTDKLPIPWKKLLFYAPTLALMAGQIGHAAIFFLVVTDLPKYMNDVLRFNIKANGVLNAVPYLLLWISACISAVIGDKLTNSGLLSIVGLRKLYTTIASVGPSVFCLLAGYMGCERVLAVIMFNLCMFTMGPFYPGMRINALDITKNFAGIMTAFVNGVGALAFTPIQSLIGHLIKHNNTTKQWQIIFWAVFVICTVTNIIYIIWASGDRAEWDIASSAKDEEEE